MDVETERLKKDQSACTDSETDSVVRGDEVSYLASLDLGDEGSVGPEHARPGLCVLVAREASPLGRYQASEVGAIVADDPL